MLLKQWLLIEKELYLIGYFHLHQKYTTQKCGKRGDKLEQFEVALSKNEDEFSYIEFHDVDFIYKGLHW